MASETTRSPVPVDQGVSKRNDTFLGAASRRFTLAISGKDVLKGSLLASASSLWFFIFLMLPMLIVMVFGFATIRPQDLTVSYESPTLNNYIRALDPDGIVVRLTIRTLIVSALTTIGSLFLAFPVAYYLARVTKPERRGLWVSLIVIPFWISFVVEVYSILPWVERNGYIGGFLNFIGLGGFADWFFGNFGRGTSNIVVPAMIYLWGTYMIFPLFTSLLRIDKELLEAAQDLGAGKWKTFWNVTVPLSFPGIVTGSILVFITTFGAYVEPQMLAGKNGYLVGNYIYNALIKFGNFPNGAAASVVVITATVVVLYLYARFAEEAGAEIGGENKAAMALSRFMERISNAVNRRRPTALPDGGSFSAGRPVRGGFERFFDRVAQRWGGTIMAVITALVIASFYIPLIQVVIFSFNFESNIIRWSHFSLRWYVPGESYGTSQEERALLGDPAIMSLGWPFGPSWGALWNSLGIGVIVTAISLALGIPAAMAIVRYKFWFKRLLNMMIYTGLVMPSIVMGVSILVFITLLNDLFLFPYPPHLYWSTGYLSIIVGHITFCIPIVIVVLIVSLREFDKSLEEAAMNLGANEWTTFFKVTLPIIKPGIVSAALLSFTFSFDELVVTSFLKGEGVETLPVVMWSTFSKKIPTPELNAVSTLIILISILFVVIANKIQKGGTMFRF